MNTANLIHTMLTTSTGTHMLDSGGDNGRHWQRNQSKSLADFNAEPEAVLEWYCKRDDAGNIIEASPEVTVSLFHKLTSGVIWQDDYCREFNAMPCDDWRGDYYGTSSEQSEWLDMRGFVQPHGSDGWNTYNWDNNFSQVIQGHNLELEGEHYVLIQVHNGADVRGGYTDAKLFRLNDYAEHHIVLTDEQRSFVLAARDIRHRSILPCNGACLRPDGSGFSRSDTVELNAKMAGERISKPPPFTSKGNVT
mgnify:CR=1 FL=1